MLSLWDVRRSAIFQGDYQRVIEKTSYIRVPAKLPLELKVIMGALAVVSVALILFGGRA
jgi:hypothetical protein